MKQLSIAIAIASHAFRHKLDKGGQPYTLHLLRVWEGVKEESVHIQCAAWLHDLLEDYPEDWSTTRLKANGFSEDTIRMVELLTHIKGEPYDVYIKKVSKNTGATKVKISDLIDNSDITRLKGLTKEDFKRLEKYSRSYHYLTKY